MNLSPQLFSGIPVLSLLVGTPAVTALLAAWIRDPKTAHQVARGGGLVTLLLAVGVLAAFKTGEPGMQFAEQLRWLPAIGVHYAMGVDGLSVLFLPFVAMVFWGALWVAPESDPRHRWAAVHLLVLMSASLGAFVATDLILFFCFFELALIPAYFLIRLYGRGAESARAATGYTLFMLLGSLPILVGFLIAGYAAAGADGRPVFDIVQLREAERGAGLDLALFVLLGLGFLVKAPAVPLHLWVARSVRYGPIGFFAYLLGVKLGTYGLLRFVVPLSPLSVADFGPYVVGVQVVAVVLAGLVALTQRDLRGVLLFSSIAHSAMITVAILTATVDGWYGAILLMINGALATACLALAAGLLERRVGRLDLAALGGVIHRAPALTAVFFVAGMALIGVPGTSGFAGELLALRGLYEAGLGFALVALLGVVLGAAYFLVSFQRAFWGQPVQPAVQAMDDLAPRERAWGGVLMALILLVGVFPGVLTQSMQASVSEHLDRHARFVANRDDYRDRPPLAGLPRNLE